MLLDHTTLFHTFCITNYLGNETKLSWLAVPRFQKYECIKWFNRAVTKKKRAEIIPWYTCECECEYKTLKGDLTKMIWDLCHDCGKPNLVSRLSKVLFWDFFWRMDYVKPINNCFLGGGTMLIEVHLKLLVEDILKSWKSWRVKLIEGLT